MGELGYQLHDQLPADVCVVPGVEVVLFEDFPATVRVPDLVVVSPGSVRTDNVTKRDEYAKAGIEQYWIVDLDEPATLTVHRLSEGEYRRFDETVSRSTGSGPVR